MAKKSSSITVYFGLSKGEGCWPELKDLSPREKSDPRTFCTFHLHLDDGTDSDILPSDIKSCTILYDGISPPNLAQDRAMGLYLDKETIVGRIRPIIRFELSRPVDPEEFRRIVWSSSYQLKPKKSPEPFFAEDWNGYTEVLSLQQEKEWAKYLRKHGVYSGKVISPKKLIAGVRADRMNPPESGDLKEMNTPVFRQKLQKARRRVKRSPQKFKVSKIHPASLVLHETTRRGIWQVSLSRPSPLLCPQPFLVAFFFPKNSSQPSGYSISLL
jgi:hypothetical protein